MSNASSKPDLALSLSKVSRNFGGIRAVTDISFDVSHGKRLTIIGTNGAGKSTLFNLITGVYTVSEGSIHIFGEEVSRQPAYKRASLGIARTFQTSKLFQGLTVRENLFAALRQAYGEKKIGWLANPKNSEKLHHESTAILESVDLVRKADVQVSEISHGESRQLEVAMALAMRPKILMLDEPAAGISPTERGRLVELLKSLDQKITLILIEHDMAVALAVADEVIVMHDGEVFVKGTPEEIRKSRAVRDLYLGSNHE
ncbi:MAG: ABC transporter ATP-binding protein [Actinomycetota bacterium]